MLDDHAAATGKSGELEAIAALIRRTGPARDGEIWAGDDMAVLQAPTALLFATDVLVEGVHFERRLGSLADAGWKALATNLSDVAAMAGTPLGAVVGVVGSSRADLDELYDGILACSARFDCPIVGGDLTDGPLLVLSIAVAADASFDPPVLRSGGRPGDVLFVTNPLGGAAAGLRQLRNDPRAEGSCVEAYRRPLPRLAEGLAARRGGASAMIDVSDGLGLDLDRLCRASRVGVELSELPLAKGARSDEAMGGGDDYELLFSAPSAEAIRSAFSSAGLNEPCEIGVLVKDETRRGLRGEEFEVTGYTHGMGRDGMTRGDAA